MLQGIKFLLFPATCQRQLWILPLPGSAAAVIAAAKGVAEPPMLCRKHRLDIYAAH
jgi:hypothetical protein